jgi:hypothetical protein
MRSQRLLLAEDARRGEVLSAAAKREQARLLPAGDPQTERPRRLKAGKA